MNVNACGELEALRRQRTNDWQELTEDWQKKGLQVPRFRLSTFKQNGEKVPVGNAVVCAQREARWVDLASQPDEILVSPVASLFSDAIEQQGLPSKLYVTYLARVFFVPSGPNSWSRYTFFGAGTARIGSASGNGR
jgi:hypothetical protein